MRSPLLSALVLLSAAACRTDKSAADDTSGTIHDGPVDADGDGYTDEEDCDDSTSLVHPGAEETCDGVDNNCDGTVDEGVTSTFYADADGDGFGSETAPTEACSEPSGFVGVGNDCDDGDEDTYPGASERCDGADNDCDGTIDEDVLGEWYADADDDGYGDPDSAYAVCDPPPGYVDNADDCDDTDGTALPGGVEVCDEADNDCDGTVDEEVTTTFYQDTDGDNYGISDVTTESCDRPTGYAALAGDCDDTNDDISPNGVELCDGVDNDCDGNADEDDAADAATWFVDGDGDGYGGSGTTRACALPSGYADNSDDCDDTDKAVSPAGTEVCNGKDDDCDGQTDDDAATDAATWYADADGDGYGTAVTTRACSQPSGFAAVGGDCNDGSADANPGETEVCDSIDNDCDSSVDEGVTTTFYLDYDGDGYGDSARTTAACTAPSGYTTTSGDCDDTEALAVPGGVEVCDSIDNDCDSSVDEGVTTTFYDDDDGDGYGDAADAVAACSAPAGHVEVADDCDDTDEDVNPGEDERCDPVDHDCDGDILATDCEDCANILDAGLDDGDGIYTIDIDGTGGQAPFEVYCDMTLDGGGWTRWWWYEGGTGFTGVTDVLADDLWDCDPATDGACFSKLPVSSPGELLVTNQEGNWAVWEFNGTTTANNVLNAFTSQTTVSKCSNGWTPVAQYGTLTDSPYHCDENNNEGTDSCDCFWYASYSGVYSFYLDDDTGWAETAFGAGYDNSGSLGVDSLETTYRYHSTTSHDLWMYFR